MIRKNKEVLVEYHDDVDSGVIIFDKSNNKIETTAIFKIEENKVLLYCNLDKENKLISIEIDGMKYLFNEDFFL